MVARNSPALPGLDRRRIPALAEAQGSGAFRSYSVLCGIWMRAVVALIDLDRPAIWVSYDEAAPPLAVLVTAEHLDPKRLQRRHRRIQRGHPHADKRAAGSTPCARDPRGGGRQYGYVHGAQLARSVNVTITVVLVFERNAERSIERHGLLEVLGEDDDRRHLSHGDLSCHALFQPTISGRSARPPPHFIPSLAQRVIGGMGASPAQQSRSSGQSGSTGSYKTTSRYAQPEGSEACDR